MGAPPTFIFVHADCQPMYRYKTFLYCTPTSRILRQMALEAKLYARIWFWALESLRLCFWPLNCCAVLMLCAHKLLRLCFGPLNRFTHAIFGPKTGKMALMYNKQPMVGVVYMSLYNVVSRRLYP